MRFVKALGLSKELSMGFVCTTVLLELFLHILVLFRQAWLHFSLLRSVFIQTPSASPRMSHHNTRRSSPSFTFWDRYHFVAWTMISSPPYLYQSVRSYSADLRIVYVQNRVSTLSFRGSRHVWSDLLMTAVRQSVQTYVFHYSHHSTFLWKGSLSWSLTTAYFPVSKCSLPFSTKIISNVFRSTLLFAKNSEMLLKYLSQLRTTLPWFCFSHNVLTSVTLLHTLVSKSF